VFKVLVRNDSSEMVPKVCAFRFPDIISMTSLEYVTTTTTQAFLFLYLLVITS